MYISLSALGTSILVKNVIESVLQSQYPKDFANTLSNQFHSPTDTCPRKSNKNTKKKKCSKKWVCWKEKTRKKRLHRNKKVRKKKASVKPKNHQKNTGRHALLNNVRPDGPVIVAISAGHARRNKVANIRLDFVRRIAPFGRIHALSNISCSWKGPEHIPRPLSQGLLENFSPVMDEVSTCPTCNLGISFFFSWVL